MLDPNCYGGWLSPTAELIDVVDTCSHSHVAWEKGFGLNAYRNGYFRLVRPCLTTNGVIDGGVAPTPAQALWLLRLLVHWQRAGLCFCLDVCVNKQETPFFTYDYREARAFLRGFVVASKAEGA